MNSDVLKREGPTLRFTCQSTFELQRPRQRLGRIPLQITENSIPEHAKRWRPPGAGE